jgi:hypothetical protein
VRDTWKDAQFSGPAPRNVLVHGVTASAANRRVFEDGFAQALREAGVTATPSYPLLPEDGEIPQDRLRQAVARSGADGVIVTRVLQRSIEPSPARFGIGLGGGSWGGGSTGSYSAVGVSAPVGSATYEALTLESTLKQAATDRVLWSGTVDSSDRRDAAALTSDMARKLIAKMKEDGVL